MFYSIQHTIILNQFLSYCYGSKTTCIIFGTWRLINIFINLGDFPSPKWNWAVFVVSLLPVVDMLYNFTVVVTLHCLSWGDIQLSVERIRTISSTLSLSWTYSNIKFWLEPNGVIYQEKMSGNERILIMCMELGLKCNLECIRVHIL